MTVKIHESTMIDKDELFVHPSNSNKQSKHVFAELRKSIKEEGFDETLLVVPRSPEEGFGYWVVAGNHRLKAGVLEGMTSFPCVIRDDWDEVKEQVQLVKRNYVRGNLDKGAFTVAVDTLTEGHAVSIDDIRSEMGFANGEDFMALYKTEHEQEEQIERVRSEQAPKVKMIDDLGMVLSSIFEQYGDTVNQSFIIFPAGGKKHLFIASTPALRRVLGEVASKCISEHLDINMVLGGLLIIGMEHSQWKTPETDVEKIIDAGTEDGDSEFA